MSRQTGKAEEECPHNQEMLRTNVLSKSTATASSSRQHHYWLQGVRSGPRGSIQVQRVLAVGSEDTVSSSRCPKYGGVRSRLRQLQASHGTNSDATTNRNAKPGRVPGRILGALK
jgi:hypothetical protein